MKWWWCDADPQQEDKEDRMMMMNEGGDNADGDLVKKKVKGITDGDEDNSDGRRDINKHKDIKWAGVDRDGDTEREQLGTA